jgi:hypothetical protein
VTLSIPLLFDPAVRAVLTSVGEGIHDVLGSSLVGLYVFGSLATGDFDAGISDVDLIAVLDAAPSEPVAREFRRMHEDLVARYPAWDDRIEVLYISRRGLAECLTETTTIGYISPGEPFDVVEAGRDWILNWYPARAQGIALLGPPIDTLIPPISWCEFAAQLRPYLEAFTERVPDDCPPGEQAYAILTLCRGLCALRFGEHVSKRASAAWAQKEFPDRAELIADALTWREHQYDAHFKDGSATLAETRAFVAETVAIVQG